jgi:GTP-binding protein Era
MNRMARAAVEGVDVVLLVLDASTPPREEDEGWMRRLMREPCPCYVVLNKQDQGDRYAQAYRELWAGHAAECAPGRDAAWFTVSAQNRDGVDGLVNALFEEVPPGPYLFPADVLTDFPRKIAVADIIREKLLRNLHDELPHSVAVFVDQIQEDGDAWTVRATIYVQKYSQKAIVIGKKGRLMRSTRRASEREMENIYEKKVAVELWVKVEKDWPRNFWFLKKLGYVN